MKTKENWDLATTQKVTDALKVFSSGNIDNLIGGIESEVRSIVCDVTTAKGRKDIASLAYKIRRSKTALDSLGKNLVKGWKDKSKAVDAERKEVRDRLDELSDEVRRPLVEWEELEKARIEKEALDKEIAEAHDQGIEENDLFDRQKKIEEKEEQLRLAEAERERIENEERLEKEAAEARRVAKEEAAEAERERIKREERLKKEAAEAARREAKEEAAKAERERIKRAKEEAAKAERERIKREERLKKEAAEAAEAARREAKEEAERERKATNESHRRALKYYKEAEERAMRKQAEAKRKAANESHRRAVNKGIFEHFVDMGIKSEDAKLIITKVAKNEVPNLAITY